MISEIMVLRTPILLFNAPPNVLKITAEVNDFEKPKPRQEIAVPINPITKTLFLPNVSVSARRPHIIEVTNWAAVKAPWMMPVCFDMVPSGRDGSKDFS